MKWTLLIIVLCSVFSISLVSCREDAELDNGISIEGLSNDTLVVESTILTFDLKVTAQDGLSLFKVNEQEFEVKGLKTYSTTYTFKADLNTPGGRRDEDTVTITVYVKDQDGDVMQKSMKIRIMSVQKAIQQGFTGLQDTTIYFVDRDITADQVWYTGKIYVLKKRITVKAPAKLTIQKGVIVKGETNPQETSALVISRGAKIDAQGTGSQPIIFTFSRDFIAPGELAPKQSFNFLDMHAWDEERDVDYSKEKGVWGGLVILGKARGSFPGDVSEYALPGFEGFGESARYGGVNNEDNSGILKNIFIRFGGNRLDTGKRISSLTLAGVGSGTIVENIEIYQGAEDGIAIYGGTVNLSNVIMRALAEDGIQVDQGWSGSLDNFSIGNIGSYGINIMGPKGTYFNGNHVLKDGSIYCYPCKGYLNLAENSNTYFSKTVFRLIPGWTGNLLFQFAINRMPKSYNSKIENLEVLDVKYMGINGQIWELPSDWKEKFFKEIPAEELKSVEYLKNSVGPKLDEFLGWSWYYRFLLENGGYIPGI